MPEIWLMAMTWLQPQLDQHHSKFANGLYHRPRRIRTPHIRTMTAMMLVCMAPPWTMVTQVACKRL